MVISDFLLCHAICKVLCFKSEHPYKTIGVVKLDLRETNDGKGNHTMETA